MTMPTIQELIDRAVETKIPVCLGKSPLSTSIWGRHGTLVGQGDEIWYYPPGTLPTQEEIRFTNIKLPTLPILK